MNTAMLKGTSQIKSQDNKVLFSKMVEVSQQGEEYDVREIKIDATTVDDPIDFGGVSEVKFLYLESTKPISLKVNGSSVPTSRGKVFLLTGTAEGPLTSLLVSNPNSEEAIISVVIMG